MRYLYVTKLMKNALSTSFHQNKMIKRILGKVFIEEGNNNYMRYLGHLS